MRLIVATLPFWTSLVALVIYHLTQPSPWDYLIGGSVIASYLVWVWLILDSRL